jgi:antirestriction protein
MAGGRKIIIPQELYIEKQAFDRFDEQFINIYKSEESYISSNKDENSILGELEVGDVVAIYKLVGYKKVISTKAILSDLIKE